MMKTLYRHFEELMSVVLLAGVCVLVAFNVLSRYLLQHPSAWAEELCTYLFVWMVFIGASLALKRREHFAVDCFVERLSPRLKWSIGLLADILVFALSVLVLWYGILATRRAWPVVTPALEISRAIPYAAVPFGGLLMSIRSIEHLAERFGWMTPSDETADDSGKEAVC